MSTRITIKKYSMYDRTCSKSTCFHKRFRCRGAGPFLGPEYTLQGARPAWAVPVQGLLNYPLYIQKAYPFLQEGRNRHLVGRVEHSGGQAPVLSRPVGQVEATEGIAIQLAEG